MTEKSSKQHGEQLRPYCFKPGESGNPGGRPKGCAKALRDIEDAVEEYEVEHGVSYWKAATFIAIKLADKGNTSLLAKIIDKFVSTKVEVDGQLEGTGETRIVIIRPNGLPDKDKAVSGQISVQQ